MNKGILICMFTIICGQLSLAQSDTAVIPLDEVVVTANRFPQKQQTTGKVLTVIPRSVIEKSGGMTVSELLNSYAGIAIAGANNNMGTNQDLYMRGAATGNSLLLLDGVPIYDVSTIGNTFDLNHFSLEQIERIEILKGAQSTVYGSDAVAGVINIITRRNTPGTIAAFGSMAAGSYGTFRGMAGIRGNLSKSSYQLSYQHNRSDGFSAAYDSSGKQGFDRDGSVQHAISAQAGGKFGQRIDWKANGLWGRYRTDLDGSAFRDERDFTADNINLQAGTGLAYTKERSSINVNYQFSLLDRTYLDDSAHVGGFATFSRDRYKGVSHFTEIYGRTGIGEKWELLAGLDHRRQQTDQTNFSISSYGPYSSALSSDSARINIFSAYASAFFRGENGFHLEAGGRFNRHSRFGDHTTFTFNPSFLWKNNWKFFFNISSAFKAPSLYQLYDAGVGEPALKPERSVTAETGLQYVSGKKDWQARLVFFVRDIRDGIDFNYTDYRYFNYNRQRSGGLELESEYRKGRWSITQQYSFVEGQVNTVKYAYDPGSYTYIPSGDTTFNNLYRRPRHSMSLSAGYQAGQKLFLRLSARLVGMRYEPRFMDSPLELKPYQVVDIYGEYRVSKRAVFFADLRNILNATYFDVAGFNTRGRNFMSGLRFQF